jgi:hypothetical protein
MKLSVAKNGRTIDKQWMSKDTKGSDRGLIWGIIPKFISTSWGKTTPPSKLWDTYAENGFLNIFHCNFREG